MFKQGKIWGNTSLIFNLNNVEIHRLECIKNGYCSKHKHINKFNMFFVETGKLKIEIWKEKDLIDETILNKHEECIIEPDQFHRFTCLEDGTIVYEIYWVKIDENDIIRETIGGYKKE
jgi:tellurite resistance-related uncharacterized protein